MRLPVHDPKLLASSQQRVVCFVSELTRSDGDDAIGSCPSRPGKPSTAGPIPSRAYASARDQRGGAERSTDQGRATRRLEDPPGRSPWGFSAEGGVPERITPRCGTSGGSPRVQGEQQATVGSPYPVVEGPRFNVALSSRLIATAGSFTRADRREASSERVPEGESEDRIRGTGTRPTHLPSEAKPKRATTLSGPLGGCQGISWKEVVGCL